MRIEYRYSDEDFFALCEAKGGFGWRRRTANLLFWVIALFNLGWGGWMFLDSLMTGRSGGEWFLANVALGLLMLAFRYIVTPWSRRRALNQQMIHGRDVVIETDDTGVSGTIGPTSARAEWSGIHRTDETASHFIVWTSKMTGFSIPKAALGSDGGVAAFRNQLETRTRLERH